MRSRIVCRVVDVEYKGTNSILKFVSSVGSAPKLKR